MGKIDAKVKFDLLDVFLVKLKGTNDRDLSEKRRGSEHQQPSDQSAEEVDVDWPTTNRVRRRQSSPLLETSYSNRIEKRFEDLTDLYYTRLPPDYVLDMTRSQKSTQNTSIVSSIEFDRDDEFFAVGGILKDIKIFDFKLTGQISEDDQPTTHCPVSRISCDYKVSCLSWSSYLKSQVASADYQGIINVWDVTTGKNMTSFSEHKKRAWSVDTSLRNPNLLVSGSDDTTVKVWSINSQSSIFTFLHKGNICCAKFAPNNSNYLAVGSADHDILCYDLRFPSSPVRCYQGHQKAVSYVRWMNDNELISASTDNSLKLWNRESTKCLRTFSGHTNEKNFVGLSVTDDWIACGSETNMVYTYHKHSKTPVAQYRFPMNDRDGKSVDECDPTYFVSSVCWKNDSSKLISANSKGIIYVLQLK
ncbi:WD40-repeat-containing domain protein [Sporodiniella umbellata]|nr:WD40-repeat-containing domain protein [Sporodiniella umbellata]